MEEYNRVVYRVLAQLHDVAVAVEAECSHWRLGLREWNRRGVVTLRREHVLGLNEGGLGRGCGGRCSVKFLGGERPPGHFPGKTASGFHERDPDQQRLLLRLAESGYSDGQQIEIIYKNAQADFSMINSILQDLVRRKVDIIVPLSTPCIQATVQVAGGHENTKVVFTDIFDPYRIGGA